MNEPRRVFQGRFDSVQAKETNRPVRLGESGVRRASLLRFGPALGPGTAAAET
jgi:hypothetical protein